MTRILALIAVAAAACSPQDAAQADATAIADIVQMETLDDVELDGTDSLPDAIADAADTVVAEVSDAAVDAAVDADVPYWIAHDIDISGLGTVNPPGASSAGCDPYITVQPNAPDTPPACASACPAPYPCTCGTCPWIQTPPMNVQRYGAKAVWTGDEVLVFGGWSSTLIGGVPNWEFTAERWKPSGTKGFEMIALPAAVTSAMSGAWVDVVWTGSEAIVFMKDTQFTFDPKTSKLTVLPLSPVTVGLGIGARVFWVQDTLFVWGYDRATSKPEKPVPHIATWRKDTGWQDVPPPAAIMKAGAAGAPQCATILDNMVYALDCGAPAAASGVDVTKPLLIRYSLVSKSWEALPQTMASGTHCNPQENILFAAFPDGIAFIPRIDGGPNAAKYPAVGAIWWKATSKWTAMVQPPIIGPLAVDMNAVLWTGDRFVIAGPYFFDPGLASILAFGLYKEWPGWPTTFDPYANQFGYMTSVGFPKHSRDAMAWAWTGSELIALGGTNGIDFETIHKDGVRHHLGQP
jgi:hypothetical protein